MGSPEITSIPRSARHVAIVAWGLTLLSAAGCGVAGRLPPPAPPSMPTAGLVAEPLAPAPRATDPAARARCEVHAVLGGHTPVASGAVALATGYGSLWASGFGAVTRLKPGGRVAARIRTPGTGDHTEVAVGDRGVWVTSPSRGVVYRIDPSTNRVVATLELAGSVQGIAVAAARVWVTRALPGPGQLLAIDPRSDRVTRPPIEVGRVRGPVISGLHDIWVQNTSPPSVMRVNPVSGRVTTVVAATPEALGSTASSTIAVGFGGCGRWRTDR